MHPAALAYGLMSEVRCEIRPVDIEAMDYWLNEAGMSDPCSQNAIAFAIRRIVRPGLSVRIASDPGTNLFQVLVGTEQILLPAEWKDWWTRAIQGGRMEPISAMIRIPTHLLAAPAPRRPSSTLYRRFLFA